MFLNPYFLFYISYYIINTDFLEHSIHDGFRKNGTLICWWNWLELRSQCYRSVNQTRHAFITPLNPRIHFLLLFLILRYELHEHQNAEESFVFRRNVITFLWLEWLLFEIFKEDCSSTTLNFDYIYGYAKLMTHL